MSGNQLKNAGFQDGISDWSTPAGWVKSIDDSVYGYEGRAVFKATKNVALNDDGYIIAAVGNTPPVQAGQTVEVFGHAYYNRGDLTPYVRFNGMTDIPIPLITKGDGNPRLGLAGSFDFYHGRIVAPTTGNMELTFRRTQAASAGDAVLLLMKPYLEVLPSSKTKYRCWDPGSSTNPDLDIPHWPSELPHIRAEGFSLEPIPTHKGFATDSGVEVTQRILNQPWYKARGTVKVNQETQAIFDQFFRNTKQFWFVRPDTLQLCLATWLSDGDPVYSGLGADKMASFGLQIHVL